MRQLPIPGTEGTETCPLVRNHSSALAAAAARALERIKHPEAKNTRKAYDKAWTQWLAHCSQHHVPAIPIEPSHLVTYLESRTDLAPNSVRLHLAGLCKLDQELRIGTDNESPVSIRSHLFVTRWLDGWAREHPRAPRKKAAAASRSELDRILVAAQERAPGASRPAHVLRYCRDRAILLFGVVGAFRGDELSKLDLRDVVCHDRGLLVTLRTSKTDQHGESMLKVLQPMGMTLRCPVDAWRCWVAARGDWEGPLFAPVLRSGVLEHARLSTDAIGRMVRARAAAAGLSLSSHSMRATFATIARTKGKSIEQIMKQAGWTEAQTAYGYVRQIDMFSDALTAGLLDD